ncbi:MAG: hypothetical protein NTY69_03070 [Methylococcales bacterium]|nr:hypothetical protein [Methylococcales bacterium]
MNYKQILALPILGLAFSGVGHATNLISSINNANNLTPVTIVPQDYDYVFNNRGLSGAVTSNDGNYQLNLHGTGNINFYQQSSGASVTGSSVTASATNYSLVANFSSSGAFISSGSALTITGTVPDVSGVTGSAGGLLYSADLTGVGFNKDTGELGFNTHFNNPSAWSINPVFTGGSPGEVVYLFDQAGLSTGHGNLSGLISALQAGTPGNALGALHGIQSIASVPLPLPVVLFGTGLTALMGFARKRRNQTNSI